MHGREERRGEESFGYMCSLGVWGTDDTHWCVDWSKNTVDMTAALAFLVVKTDIEQSFLDTV